MFTAKKIINNKYNIDNLKKLFGTKNIKCQKESIIYVLKEEDSIIGCSIVDVYSNKESVLKTIVIKEKRRGENLGDFLIRATFNYLDRKGIKYVYFENKNSYLKNIGFESIKNLDINYKLSNIINDMYLFYNIEKLFNKHC